MRVREKMVFAIVVCSLASLSIAEDGASLNLLDSKLTALDSGLFSQEFLALSSQDVGSDKPSYHQQSSRSPVPTILGKTLLVSALGVAGMIVGYQAGVEIYSSGGTSERARRMIPTVGGLVIGVVAGAMIVEKL